MASPKKARPVAAGAVAPMPHGAKAAKTAQGKGPNRRNRLTPKDWVDAARATLIRSGVNAIKVDQLAKDLGVTRGSFYWHFPDYAVLLDSLLASWVKDNTGPFLRALEHDEDQPLVQILRYCEVWLSNDEFEPAYDAAVRDWARASDEVAEVVRRVDEERMDVLYRLLQAVGYDRQEALVRTRTIYYHQIGYYALKVVQSPDERLALAPIYFNVLTGCPVPPGRRRYPKDAEPTTSLVGNTNFDRKHHR